MKISVQGIEVSAFSKNPEDDFISLTDIARYKNSETGLVISHWLSNRSTIEFIGVWEKIHNPNFKVTEYSNFKNESGSNGFALSVQQWVESTRAIGISAKRGRHGGGTYAHKDIAFEFASWISPEFKLYLIKEFQRLKSEENERLRLGWNVKRVLAKLNYKIHTDSVKENLIPALLSKHDQTTVFASEADMLNLALFGLTAKQWRNSHPKKAGNIRDDADVIQLVVLANLESMNAELIREGLSQKARLLRLNRAAISQMRSLLTNSSQKKLTSS